MPCSADPCSVTLTCGNNTTRRCHDHAMRGGGSVDPEACEWPCARWWPRSSAIHFHHRKSHVVGAFQCGDSIFSKGFRQMAPEQTGFFFAQQQVCRGFSITAPGANQRGNRLAVPTSPECQRGLDAFVIWIMRILKIVFHENYDCLKFGSGPFYARFDAPYTGPKAG